MTLALIATAILLLIALAMHSMTPLFRRLHLPVSVIAGFLGLAITYPLESPPATEAAETNGLIAMIVAQWRTWPGWLIAVVFAGMLLERAPSSAKDSLRRAGREGLMVWIIVLGQTTVGLLLTWVWLGPQMKAPDAFGMLIETGFAGGHGTAAAMGEVFANTAVPLDGGLDLGIMMATVGLVYGIVSGIIWINLGVRMGWVRSTTASSHLTIDTDQPKSLKADPDTPSDPARPSLAIEPLLLQLIWLTLAFAIGWLLQTAVNESAAWSEGILASSDLPNAATKTSLDQNISFSEVVSSFPLFIYTLFGGWIVRRVLSVIRCDHWIDGPTISQVSSMAMDILVVSAIASLNLSVVSGQWQSLTILIVAAAIWTAFCLLVLSRRILPSSHWFELGLINYGMSTGTTATGFVLLRMIDPKLESGAAEDYALAAPLSSPFIGGGMVTVGLPILVLGNVSLAIVVPTLIAIVLVLVAVGYRVATKQQSAS